ncbi:hypothetical protein [Streptomyces sp. NPDC018693]|uniref:hypothetical protein n=1 Tax=unclassified Streptomyces TaxID=2593676 RepID=UPI0037A62F94
MTRPAELGAGRRLRLPEEPGAVRRRTLWHRTWGLCAALLGAAMLLLGGLFLTLVPELIQDEKTYGAATACTDRSAAHDECLRPFEATVTRTVIKDQPKTSEYELYLNGPAQVPDSIPMGGPGPLLKRLSRGDQVTVTMWRDYAVEVRRGAIAQKTADTPEGEPAFTCALGLALLTGGAYGLYAGGTTLRGARRHAERGLPATLLTRGKEALGAVLCAGLTLIVGDLTNIPVMLAAWLALLPLVRWAVRRSERRVRGRHARPIAGM